MTAALFIQIFLQTTLDAGTGQIVGSLTFTAPDEVNAIVSYPTQFFYIVPGVHNVLTSPFPTCPDANTAIADFYPAAETYLIATANSNIGATYYVSPSKTDTVNEAVRAAISLATPSAPFAWDASTSTPMKRLNAFPYHFEKTVSSGAAVINLTDTGLSGGTYVFPTSAIDASINTYVNDPAASYQIGHAFTNSGKTLTLTVNKLGTANILTGILGQVAAPNGTVIRGTIWGY